MPVLVLIQCVSSPSLGGAGHDGRHDGRLHGRGRNDGEDGSHGHGRRRCDPWAQRKKRCADATATLTRAVCVWVCLSLLLRRHGRDGDAPPGGGGGRGRGPSGSQRRRRRVLTVQHLFSAAPPPPPPSPLDPQPPPPSPGAPIIRCVPSSRPPAAAAAAAAAPLCGPRPHLASTGTRPPVTRALPRGPATVLSAACSSCDATPASLRFDASPHSLFICPSWPPFLQYMCVCVQS